MKNDYGPFGEVIRQTGPMAKANLIRFSTKYQDDESDLLYYGYRYYKASTGTWVSRDPKPEVGFELLSHNELQIYGTKAKVVPTSFHLTSRKALPSWLNTFQSPVTDVPGRDGVNKILVEDDAAGSVCNGYMFDRNDAVDRADVLGLYDYSLTIPCANVPLCVGYCTMHWSSPNKSPVHPYLLSACLATPAAVAGTACDICCRPLWKTACDAMEGCFQLYW